MPTPEGVKLGIVLERVLHADLRLSSEQAGADSLALHTARGKTFPGMVDRAARSSDCA